MRMSLVKILTWKSPVKSVLAVILLNLFLLRFMFHQRPLCGASVLLLLCFLRNQWKQRRSQVLQDPLDSEEWVKTTSYDPDKSLFDFAKTFLETWMSLRRDHYFILDVLDLTSHIRHFGQFPNNDDRVVQRGIYRCSTAPLLKRYQFELVRSQG